MKDWQRGFELQYLKNLEQKYVDYNAYTLSPFAQFKKNNIAESLHKGTLVNLGDAMMEVSISKSASDIQKLKVEYQLHMLVQFVMADIIFDILIVFVLLVQPVIS